MRRVICVAIVTVFPVLAMQPQPIAADDANALRVQLAKERKENSATESKLRRVLERSRDRGERLSASIYRDAAGTPAERHLAVIAACESGSDPRAVSPGGTYRAKHQFDLRTWRSVGGHGDPVDATETEQDWRALLLYLRRGAAPWPVCG